MSQPPLPKLRENLSRQPQKDQSDQQSNWLIYDSIAHRFYQIGQLEYLILSVWHLGSKKNIINTLKHNHKRILTENHFDEFFDFLLKNQLLKHSTYASTHHANKHNTTFVQQLQKIFSLRIHLINPNEWLDIILPHCQWLFGRAFNVSMLFIIFIGALGISQNFDSYQATFVSFLSFQDITLWISALIIIKIIHELSHAITAKHYGCSVSSIGVAFLIFWPVLYTDTTNAWSLQKKKQRILISSAGIISEIYVAGIASICWLLLPDGTARSIAFILSSTAWATSLFINANPFMRFDGYFVLSDIVGIPNLHQSASHYLNQFIDRHLFGLPKGNDLPYVKPSYQTKLIIFGAMIWVYRLALTFFITWLIYNLVFKLLAIILMGIYLINAIIIPIFYRVKRLSMIPSKRYNKKVLARSSIILAAFLFLLLFPWRSSIEVPAIMHFKNSSTLYANSNAIIDQLLVSQGQYVHKGDTLAILTSELINYDATKTLIEYDKLKWKLTTTSLSDELKSLRQTTIKELEEKKSKYESVIIQNNELIITAPHDGFVSIPSFHIQAGTAFRKNQEVLSVVEPSARTITGYINENTIAYVDDNTTIRFFREGSLSDVYHATLDSISAIGVDALEQPYLASIYGGDIAVRQNRDGVLIPEKGVYSIKAHIPEPINQHYLPFITRGTMVLSAKPYSIGQNFFDFVYAGFLKHSSF